MIFFLVLFLMYSYLIVFFCFTQDRVTSLMCAHMWTGQRGITGLLDAG